MSTIYFVIPQYYRKRWPPLLQKAVQGQKSLSNIAHELTSGIDVWILQTWLILSNLPNNMHAFTFKLAEHGIPNAICLFHYDNAKPCHGLFDCYPIVVQADRPTVPFAEIRIMQNPAVPQTHKTQYLYLWPQPGLIPRDPQRGTTIKNLAIPGSMQYLPSFIHSESFRQRLKELDITLQIKDTGNWMDYSHTDLILAWRQHTSQRVLNTKPPSKLINAWHAETPALLGPEPAYQALRKHPDDYIEVQSLHDIIQYLTYIKKHPDTYLRIINHYKQRAQDVTTDKLIQIWLNLFEHVQKLKQSQTTTTLKKYTQYFSRKLYNQMLKTLRIWND